MKCRALTIEERNNIFRMFWCDMKWQQRKTYINFLVKKENTKRERNRKEEQKSRREYSWLYFLKNSEQKLLRVCKKMFLNTLDLKERTIIDWKNVRNRTQMTSV